MKLTNNHGLPVAFERFEAKNTYDSGGAEFSITTLIDAPQIHYLRKKHDDLVTEDISSRVLSILGTATHNILEHGADPDDIKERRLFATVDGVKISGQLDLMKLVAKHGEGEKEAIYELRDYKTVSGTSLVINTTGSSSWELQLNGYAFLAAENGFRLNGIGVTAIVRDWSHNAVRRNQNFPKQPVVDIKIPMWSYEEQRDYIRERVRLHKMDPPPECSDDDRWKGGAIYAVMEYKVKGGLKARANKLFKTSTQALSFIIENDLKAEIVTRDTVPTRCIDNYCRVSHVCPQFAKD